MRRTRRSIASLVTRLFQWDFSEGGDQVKILLLCVSAARTAETHNRITLSIQSSNNLLYWILGIVYDHLYTPQNGRWCKFNCFYLHTLVEYFTQNYCLSLTFTCSSHLVLSCQFFHHAPCLTIGKVRIEKTWSYYVAVRSAKNEWQLKVDYVISSVSRGLIAQWVASFSINCFTVSSGLSGWPVDTVDRRGRECRRRASRWRLLWRSRRGKPCRTYADTAVAWVRWTAADRSCTSADPNWAPTIQFLPSLKQRPTNWTELNWIY